VKTGDCEDGRLLFYLGEAKKKKKAYTYYLYRIRLWSLGSLGSVVVRPTYGSRVRGPPPDRVDCAVASRREEVLEVSSLQYEGLRACIVIYVRNPSVEQLNARNATQALVVGTR
jgi:hypothetical protein